MKNYLLMKSKIPTYLKYYLSKTRLDGLVFNKTYLENLSGTSFYLDHSIEDKIKINFKASESTQESTTGKQLLKIDDTSSKGVTYLNNSDGSVLLNGSNTNDINFYKNITLPAGTYYLNYGYVSGNITSENVNYFQLLAFSGNTQLAGFIISNSNYTNNNNISFTLTEETNVQIRLYIGSVVRNFSNFKFYFMLTKDNYSYEWEKFTGGQASPNPDYPQDIHVVKGDNEVVIENKNLFDKDNANILNAYINGTNKKIEALNTTKTLYISCEPNTTYTIQRLAGQRFIAISSPNYEIGTTGTNIVQNNTGSVITINTGDNDRYLCVFYYHSSHDTLTEQEILDSIQIEEGPNASSYVEHKEQNYSLSLGTLEMCNINNYADAFFKNVPECEYYDNTLESGKWYKYGRIGKVILDGSEVWKYTNGVFYINGFLRFVKGQPVLSNYFKYGGSATNTTTAYQNGNNTISFNVDDGSSIYIRNDNVSSLNDFKSWLSTHNTEVYYILATPTKTLLSDTLQDELENIYNNAHTYDKITNINQVNDDRPFILDISYYRKVK